MLERVRKVWAVVGLNESPHPKVGKFSFREDVSALTYTPQ